MLIRAVCRSRLAHQKTNKIVKTIYLAGGCFWGTEHFFKQIHGVVNTTVGYANGNTESPTYEEVCSDTTHFAETVKVEYDEKKVPLFFLLRMYFLTIDPTQVDEQGADKGSQYRTGIYYEDEADKAIIEDAVAEESFAFSDPIATEVMPLKNFYAAEEYHQDYLDKNPSGYCHISPELMKMARETQRIDN